MTGTFLGASVFFFPPNAARGASSVSPSSFSGIRTNERCFHGQENRKRSKFGFRVNGVAKSDVNLHWNPCSGQLGLELDAHAIVLVILFDSCAFDRLAVEHNAVFVLNLADRANIRFYFA